MDVSPPLRTARVPRRTEAPEGTEETRSVTALPLVSAIVLFHDKRTAEHAARSIGALREQTIANDLEIIVVDNHADDNSSQMLRKLCGEADRIRLVETPENLGYGRGNNFGADRARGEFLLIINPDNRLESEALGRMVRFMREHPDVGIVGPQLVFPDGTVRDSFRTFPTPLDLLTKRTPLRFLRKKRMTRYLQWDRDPNQTRDVDWLCGACLLIRRAFFGELGGFDPRFFLFFEDCDLCRRCWNLGRRVVYCPDAKARDSRHRLSSGGMFSFLWKKTVRVHIASAIKYFWKWRGGRDGDGVGENSRTL